MQLINNNIKYTSCPLCGENNFESKGEITHQTPLFFSTTPIQLEKKSSLCECKVCGSGFKQNIIPEDVAMSLYGKGNSNERWKTISFNKSKLPEVVDAFKKIFTPGLFVLDIGCNTGELLDVAKENGSITHGNEPSPESQKILVAKGHHVFNTLTEIEDKSMDVITAFDLIEHVYDVPGFLRLCKLKMKDDGRLVVFTGNINSVSARWAGSKWWYIKYPEHVSFPSVSLLERNGFKLEENIATYASIGYKKSLFKSIKALIKGKLTFNYKGLPSWGPDHYMAILRNDN